MMVQQLRSSLRSLDEMRSRFVEERNQWNAERDQLKTTAREVCASLMYALVTSNADN